MDYYLGQIIMFAGNFAPKNWMLCSGQILAIAQNQALFSILGTTYGGDGRTTFALPDLQGRVPISSGQGPRLPNITLGEIGGSETVSLTVAQIPAHNHTIAVNNTTAETGNPNGAVYGKAVDSGSGTEYQIYNQNATVAMNAGAMAVAGASQPHSNLPPLLALNYIICISGIFPSRN
jgi:microcystin-dependent protein